MVQSCTSPEVTPPTGPAENFEGLPGPVVEPDLTCDNPPNPMQEPETIPTTRRIGKRPRTATGLSLEPSSKRPNAVNLLEAPTTSGTRLFPLPIINGKIGDNANGEFSDVCIQRCWGPLRRDSNFHFLFIGESRQLGSNQDYFAKCGEFTERLCRLLNDSDYQLRDSNPAVIATARQKIYKEFVIETNKYEIPCELKTMIANCKSTSKSDIYTIVNLFN